MKLFRTIYALLTHELMLFAIAVALCIGTYYARASVSIATGVLGVIAALVALQPYLLKKAVSNLAVLALMLAFAVVLLSGIVSENTDMWLKRLGTNIPYLVIPLGVWAFGGLERRRFVALIMIYVLATVFSSILLVADYLLHLNEYNQLYNVGKTIPTPIIHVRYSYFLAVGAICSFGLLLDRNVDGRIRRNLVLACGMWLAICVHILAVRTGILSLYVGVAGIVAIMVAREKRWKEGLAVGIALVLIFLGSLKLLPSMANKLNYVMYDLKMLREKGPASNYSDNIRLVSIQQGLELFRKNPVFGVGAGDIDDEMNALYQRSYPEMPMERRYPPISQLIYWLATYGSVGTLALLVLLGYPIYRYGKKSYLLAGLYILTFTSFIGETTIQLQLGKTMFVWLVSITVMHLWLMERAEKTGVGIQRSAGKGETTS